MQITNAFLDGMMMASKHEVRIINSYDSKVEYCRGCFTCMHNGGNCVIDDDMKNILKEITESELLILSFPLYGYSFPASLKAVIDRTLPLTSMEMRKSGDRYEHIEQRDFSSLKFMMICGCGFPNSAHNFEPAVKQFKYMFPENQTVITVPESPMFNASAAAIVTKPRLELIRKAGRQFAEQGFVDEKLVAEISSPMIPEEEYARIVNEGV